MEYINNFVMVDTQTFKERLISFINSLGISVRAFENKCGMSNGSINNIRVSLGKEKLNKVVEQYPQLNLSWLYTGEGDMLKTVDCTNAINVNNSTQIGDNSINNVGDVFAKTLEQIVKEVADIRNSQEEDKKKMLDMQQQMLDIISQLSKEVNKK